MATSKGQERRKTRKQLEVQCYAWNAKHPVGVRVKVRLDEGSIVHTTALGEAYVLEGHSAVISLASIRGVYLLDRVTAEKRDGFDRPIDPAALYYVQDSRTVNGDCMSWWRPEAAGYTANLDDAGSYLGADVLAFRETDVPWPMAEVSRAAMRHVRWDVMRSVVESQKPVRPNLQPVSDLGVP